VKKRTRIEDDPASPISLAELAELSGLDRYRTVRAFSQECGITPYAYVIQRRVRLTRRLLLSGETLASAAQRAGFADQSHMTRAFTRQLGVPPGKYLSASRAGRRTSRSVPN
jgi:AraC-like DNA-binding protein